jgi:glycosyltransferase involved in cell wall biosynthesis
VSNAVAEEVREAYALRDEQVRVCPNGVDEAWFSARPLDPARRSALGVPASYALFVGNAEPRKNLKTLLRAHAAVKDPLPLVVIGPSGWGGVSRLLVASRAIVLGYQSETTLRSLVAGASAVCLPSLYEGFGLPIIEAMAARVPVVAADIAALREVSGGHATLLDPRDVDAWSAALDARAKGPWPRRRLDEAQAHARSFTWSRSAQLHLDAWREAEPG